MIAVFEIIGGFIRFILYNLFNSTFRKNERKKLDYFMNDSKNQQFSNLNNDYYNGIVGFLTFGLLLLLAYKIFN